MAHALTVQLSDKAYAALERRAEAGAQSPAELAAATLEQSFGIPDGGRGQQQQANEDELQAARLRFERHFGAIDLGYATGVDNEG